MAKKLTKKKIGGPFVTAALICNGISEDSDGSVSAVRIVDEVRLAVGPGAPADFPSKETPVQIALWALIIIRRGDASAGKHKLKLVMEQPDGKTRDVLKQDIELPKYPNGAANARVRMALTLHSIGTYWIDVVLDNKVLSRMALNLVVQRVQAPKAQDK